MPKKTSQKLMKLIETFFGWKTSTSSDRIPMIAWDKVYQPKTQTDLVLCQTTPINATFQFNCMWKNLQWIEQLVGLNDEAKT